MTANTTILKPADTKVTLGSRIRHQKYLLMMVIPAVVFVGIFSYMPMWGVLISFVNYNPGLGLLKSQFVGFKYFQEFLTDSMFPLLIRNSFGINALNITFGTAFPIMFALLLNEVGVLWFKKSVQTISYLPHFISFVVVANIFLNVLETYVYTIGIQQGKYSLATAVGLMRMVVGLVLILSANAVSRRISEYSLF